MPEIELLLGEDDSPSGFAPMAMLAVSAYPNNEAKRLQFLVTIAAQMTARSAKARNEKEVQIPANWLDMLLTSPPAEKILSDAVAHTALSWIAGELILFLIDAAMHHSELDVTPTKAVWVLSRLFKGAETFAGGTVSVAQRTIWKAWGRFKSVAHIHAVRQIWLQDKDRETGPDIERFTELQHDRFLEHLAVSEVIRKAAVERRILPHKDTWWPPSGLKLPPARVDFPPLPQAALDELAKYVPEHSAEAPWDEEE